VEHLRRAMRVETCMPLHIDRKVLRARRLRVCVLLSLGVDSALWSRASISQLVPKSPELKRDRSRLAVSLVRGTLARSPRTPLEWKKVLGCWSSGRYGSC
jgi:hypothetical protein